MLKKIRLSILFILLVGIWLNAGLNVKASPEASHFTWSKTILDSQNDVGEYLSLAVQPGTNIPHVAYYDASLGDLKLMVQTPGGCGPNGIWTCTVLDDTSSVDVGKYVSLAFNGSKYGVAYYDDYNNANRYTSPADGIYGESIENDVAAIYDVGTYNALAYLNKVPQVAYVRADISSDEFGFAKRVGSGGNCAGIWSCLTINSGRYFSVDVGTYGSMAVSYAGIGFLGYVYPVASGGNCSSNWKCESMLTGHVIRGTSLHVARCGLISCDDATQIAYYDYLSGELGYAVRVEPGTGNCDNTSWNCSTIDQVGSTGDGTGLALSLIVLDNQPIIVYQDINDQANSIVKITWPDANGNCGPNNTWRCEVVDDGARSGNYVNVGQALDADVVNGRIYIAYYESDNADLLLAYEPISIPSVTATPSPTAVPTSSPTPTPDPFLYDIYLPLAEK